MPNIVQGRTTDDYAGDDHLLAAMPLSGGWGAGRHFWPAFGPQFRTCSTITFPSSPPTNLSALPSYGLPHYAGLVCNPKGIWKLEARPTCSPSSRNSSRRKRPRHRRNRPETVAIAANEMYRAATAHRTRGKHDHLILRPYCRSLEQPQRPPASSWI